MCSLEDLPPEIRAQILRSINYHVDLCSAIYSNKSLFMVVFELLETLFCQEISQIQRSRGLKFAVAYAIEAIEQTTASYIEKILLCVEISVVGHGAKAANKNMVTPPKLGGSTIP